jgi:flagellar motility protein MotE (MotC chaperone)
MADIETRVTTLEQQVNSVLTKLDMFIAESREARQRQDAEIRELRHRQDAAQVKHDEDIREMRQDMKDMQARIDAKFDSMDSKIDGMGKHVRNMSIVTIIGIAAMVVAVFLK